MKIILSKKEEEFITSLVGENPFSAVTRQRITRIVSVEKTLLGERRIMVNEDFVINSITLMEKYHEVLMDTYNLIVKLHSSFVDKWAAYLFPDEEDRSA